MLVGVLSPALRAQQLASVAPPAGLPDGPDLPVAKVLPSGGEGVPLTIEAETQSERGGVSVLDGDVVVVYGERRVEADHIEYDRNTGELTATGHLRASGGANHELITASHGSLNLRTQIGHFYEVTGSVGVRDTGRPGVYLSASPFLFTGREVVKLGQENYEVIDGTVTSCSLPRPDWLLSASRFRVADGRAEARNSIFHVLNLPLLYLPYVTHPVDEETRESGLLIPIIGQSSTKGTVIGEQVYLVLGRSADLTVGAQYFSMRGYLDSATFRYRGAGNDFVQSHYSQLFDRGYTPAGGVYTNQGGEDVTFSGRHDFDDATRVVADVEYLSSYVYREAFTENFNQAVSTDILSYAYGVHERDGYAASLEADRYQGLKQVVAGATPTTTATNGAQVRIFHVPSLNLEATEHSVGSTGLRWSLDSSASGLKRVQPNFVTNGVTERFDVHPEITYPFGVGGWRARPRVGVEETIYSRSRLPSERPGAAPVEVSSSLNRADVEMGVELRAPVIERVYRSSVLDSMLHGAVKHTIEPSVAYRYVKGVNSFLSTLRFDDRDVVSDTNEIEYGVTQRLFVRPDAKEGCGAQATVLDAESSPAEEGDAVAASPRCTTRQWVSWRLAQKRFFDSTFGGALMTGRRNIFATTLDLSGVAFLTEPRSLSPLISRLRVRGSAAVDLEWDFDLDIGAKKLTANNLLIDVHRGNSFAGLSYARLNAPGRSYVEGVTSTTSNFEQMRVLLGYGSPTKRGLSVGANAGLDLNKTQVQYAAVQTSYNWDCCGFAVEYRKYELGAVRNENAYRFNLTLANIGTAGNLRRAERLF